MTTPDIIVDGGPYGLSAAVARATAPAPERQRRRM